jgi:hypothetical protein
MRLVKRLLTAACLIIGCSRNGMAQLIPPPADDVSLAGPRFGITVLSDGVIKKLKTDSGIALAPVTTQFGWQFEKQFYSGGTDGPAAITEAVVLIGGLEQGYVLPSLSWLVGVRTKGGAEFGLGPNVTPIGVALALAAGKTFQVGVLNVPVNVAFVPSKAGTRVSVLTGFSIRHKYSSGRPPTPMRPVRPTTRPGGVWRDSAS